MSSYNVTGVPQLIQPGYSGDMALYNAGGFTIYLANASSVTPLSGYPLTPGSSFTWKGGQDLWVVTETVNSADFLSPGADNLYKIASTLITSPSAVIPTSAINSRVHYTTDTFASWAAGSRYYAWLGTLIETTTFRSAIFTAKTSPSGTGTATYVPLVINVVYWDVVNGALTHTSISPTYYQWISPFDSDSGGGSIFCKIPVDPGLGKYVSILVQANGTGAYDLGMKYSLYGSPLVCEYTWYNTQMPFGSTLSTIAGGATPYTPNSWSSAASISLSGLVGTALASTLCQLKGFVDLTCIIATAGPAGSVLALTGLISGARFGSINTAATGYFEIRDIAVPAEGLQLRASSGTTAITAGLTLTFHD